MKKAAHNKSDNKFLFDGCPICSAMKKAHKEGRNLVEKELRKFSREANKQKGTVSF